MEVAHSDYIHLHMYTKAFQGSITTRRKLRDTYIGMAWEVVLLQYKYNIKSQEHCQMPPNWDEENMNWCGSAPRPFCVVEMAIG